MKSIKVASTVPELTLWLAVANDLNPYFEGSKLQGVSQTLGIWAGLKISDLQGLATGGFVADYDVGLLRDYPELKD
jgi:hypothetical protein